MNTYVILLRGIVAARWLQCDDWARSEQLHEIFIPSVDQAEIFVVVGAGAYLDGVRTDINADKKRGAAAGCHCAVLS